jgi:hypothetical protein
MCRTKFRRFICRIFELRRIQPEDQQQDLQARLGVQKQKQMISLQQECWPHTNVVERLKAAWLFVVFAYLTSIPDRFCDIIFQNFDSIGDKGRLEDGKWPRPKQQEGECCDNFLDRLAGYYTWICFFEDLFRDLLNILPTCQHMFSILASDRTNGAVGP